MRLSRFPAQGATVHHGYGITDSFWHLDVILGKPDVGSISRLNGYLQADPNPHESASCRNRQEIVSRATRRPMHSCRRSAIRLPEYITNLIDTQCLAGIFLLGHWTSRSKLEAMLSAVNHVSPQGIKPIVATDHEGGEIQNIRVPGVDHLPSQEALARMSPAKVQAVVTTGARQLAKLGVHMVFSPVAGVIDPRLGVRNKPIAKHHRGFGTDPHLCGQYSAAVVAGHRKAGIISTTKHFPGIGRITEDTDFKSAGITDDKTTRHDRYLESFRMAFDAGSEAVMIASAYYSKIDPGTLGLFSSKIMTDMLRGDFGYQGLIVSDDLGSSVSVFSVDGGHRASKFVSAGGDLAITADPLLAGPMIRALTSTATSASGKKRLVDAASHVINVKLAHSLTK